MKKLSTIFLFTSFYLFNHMADADTGFIDQWLCGSPSSSHYTTPFKNGNGYNTKVGWSLAAHHIPQAWPLSNAGRGVTIGVIDTGISANHKVMIRDFAKGLSSARSVSAAGVPFNDDLVRLAGHGTKVAAVLAAPVYASYTPAGVAYRSNIIMKAGNDDPIIAHVDHFATQLRALADNPNVKIINVSMGKAVNVPALASAIDYASNTKSKLIFATAGVTGSLQMYPASLDSSYGVMSVTGVEYDESDPNGRNLRVAQPNSFGDEVDFAAYVFRPSDGGCVLTMKDGSTATTSGRGSSLAVPTIAGIAALVWSANPSLSKNEVIDTLQKASSLYPNRSNKVGYGVVNAELAVRIAIKPRITSFSASVGSGRDVIFSALAHDPDGGPVSYRWNFGDGRSETRTSSAPFTYHYDRGGNYYSRVTVVDDEGSTTYQGVRIDVPSGNGDCDTPLDPCFPTFE